MSDDFNLHPVEGLNEFRQRHPFYEDRSVKTAFLSAKCPQWLKDDFEFITKTCEGEDGAVVLRRLVREYIRANTPR